MSPVTLLRGGGRGFPAPRGYPAAARPCRPWRGGHGRLVSMVSVSGASFVLLALGIARWSCLIGLSGVSLYCLVLSMSPLHLQY